MRRPIRLGLAAVSVLVTGLLATGAAAEPDPYTPAFRTCVRAEYDAWRADVAAFMARYPGYDETGEIARKGYPTSYEEALAHPRIGEVCGPEGSRR